MRGIFALIILFGHALLLTAFITGQISYSHVLHNIQLPTSSIVLICFFLMSGYFIDGSFDRHGGDLGKFWLARIYKIYPLLIISTIMTAIVDIIRQGSIRGFDLPGFIYSALGLSGIIRTFGCGSQNWIISNFLLSYLFWSLSRKFIGSFLSGLAINALFVVLFMMASPSSSPLPMFYLAFLLGAAINHYRKDVRKSWLKTFEYKSEKLQHLDRISYSLYLTHMQAIYLTGFLLNQVLTIPIWPLYFSITSGVAIIVGVKTADLIDIPLQRITRTKAACFPNKPLSV